MPNINKDGTKSVGLIIESLTLILGISKVYNLRHIKHIIIFIPFYKIKFTQLKESFISHS